MKRALHLLPRRGRAGAYQREARHVLLDNEDKAHRDWHEAWEHSHWSEGLAPEEFEHMPERVEVWPHDQRQRDPGFLRGLRARSEALRDLGYPWDVWAHWSVSDIWAEYDYAREHNSPSGPPSGYGVYFLCQECGLRSRANLYYWSQHARGARDVFWRAWDSLACAHPKRELPDEETWDASASLVWLTNPALLTDPDDE
jgi:hypothetical protein